MEDQRETRAPLEVRAAALLAWAGALAAVLGTLLLLGLAIALDRGWTDPADPGAPAPLPAWAYAALVVVLAVLACVAAEQVVVGRRWAQVALVALGVVALLGGLVTAYLVLPLLLSLTGLVVAVLLVLPRAWSWTAGD